MIWPLLLGINKAKGYLMRGTLLRGREAERIGSVNHCVTDPRCCRWRAKSRRSWPTAAWAIRWTKLSINQIL